ncbi:MAG: hypothetical protein ABSF63_01685 [Candidatus Bathyarchaeia archaeon]|jgi:hypothetical protein
MARRGKKMLEVDACIEAFLRTYRKSSKLGSRDEGAYYWNEREVQWELFRHLRERAVSHGIGSEWWFHAEGTVERPAYARWGARRRADIVMIDHYRFKKWFMGGTSREPEYEAMIELKLLWSGWGLSSTYSWIRADLRKLASCLGGHQTNEAHMVLIDGLDRRSTPYYSYDVICKMLASLHLRPRLTSRLHLWHWPDSDEPIEDTRTAPWEHYTAHQV